MHDPHDSLFKWVFSEPEHAEGELKLLLPPEVSQRIDWNTLERLPTSFIDEEFSKRHADVAFTVELGGRKLVLYLLLEHQSSSDPLMVRRLLTYMDRFWDEHLKHHPTAQRLPAIIPMVVHHSEHGWQPTLHFEQLYDLDPQTLALVKPHLPSFSYLLDDLSTARSDELKERVMTALGRVTLLCLSQSRKQADLLPELSRWQQLLVKVIQSDNGVAALAAVVRYILHTSETKPEGLRKLFRQLGPKVEEAYMTGAQILTQQARAGRRRPKGAQKARPKGAQKAKQKAKPSSSSSSSSSNSASSTRSRRLTIRVASSDKLDRFAERVITASSLDEVFAD